MGYDTKVVSSFSGLSVMIGGGAFDLNVISIGKVCWISNFWVPPKL